MKQHDTPTILVYLQCILAFTTFQSKDMKERCDQDYKGREKDKISSFSISGGKNVWLLSFLLGRAISTT